LVPKLAVVKVSDRMEQGHFSGQRVAIKRLHGDANTK
jgi:hypothetical protein